MPPLLTASAAVQLATDGRSAGAAGALFSHTPTSMYGVQIFIALKNDFPIYFDTENGFSLGPGKHKNARKLSDKILPVIALEEDAFQRIKLLSVKMANDHRV